MGWLFFTLVTALFYGVFNVFMKIASNFGLEGRIGTFLLNFTAVLSMSLFILGSRSSIKINNLSRLGILFAIFAGISAAIGNTARFISFEKGAPLVTSQLITSIGALVIASILSLIIFKELFTLGKLVGLIMGVIGLFLMIKY